MLVVSSTWNPKTVEELNDISDLQTNKDLNIVPIAEQETISKAAVFSQTSLQNINWVANPDGQLSNKFQIESTPVHYFVNRSGIIKNIVNGPTNQNPDTILH